MTDIDEARAQGPHDHPVIAALAGCAVLVLAAILGPMLLAPPPLSTLLAAGAGFGVVLWAIGYLVTIRHASWGWKLGSLAILAGAGAAAGWIAHGQYQARARADASSFAEIEYLPGGALVLPRGAAARGSLSRLFAESVAADAQERRDFGDALGKFAPKDLTSPYLLARNAGLLGRCSELGAIKAMARTHSRQRADRRATLERAVAASALPEDLRGGIAIMAGAAGEQDALLANQLATLDATGELCALLARRGWRDQGGDFAFASAADKARFDALAVRRLQLAGEAERIERAETARSKQGQEMVRAALS